MSLLLIALPPGPPADYAFATSADGQDVATHGSAAPALLPQAQLLLQYLRAARWNVSAVAHQLGISRMTVYRRMQRWGIRAPGHD